MKPVIAQTDLSYISFQLGTVRNFQNFSDNINYDKYALSPEIDIGGKFILPYLQWEIFLSYWDDMITDEIPIKDYVGYSNRVISSGGRIIFNLDNFFLTSKEIQVSILTGVIFQINNAEPLTPLDIYGKQTTVFSENLVSPLVGLRIKYKIIKLLALQLEYLEYISTSENYDFRRNAILGGISIGF